jgi:hypothetical protein
MGLTPIILIPQVILAGLIVRFAHMNTAIKAMSGLMISRWSFEASLIGEYKNTNQEEIINSIGFNPGNIALDFFIIALFYSTFFGLTALFLKRKDVK